jgi:fucose 4-O-acetylase-like acetyltransferase
MVLLVLIFHSGASYGSAVEFWPFHEANPSKIIDLFMFLLDTFMMSILFFIAGYFALPSLQKRGIGHFLKDKLKRLGLPWLIVTILLLPLLDYLHYRSNSVNSGLLFRGYAEHWFLSIKRITEFNIGWMNMSAYLDMTEHFTSSTCVYLSANLTVLRLASFSQEVNLFGNQ